MASRKTPKVPGSLTELRQRWAGAGRDDLLAKDVQAVAGQIPDSAASQILSFLGRELGVVELGELLEHPRAQQAVRSAMKLADRTRFLAALNDLSATAPGEDGPAETRRWNARPPAELRAIAAPRDPREVRDWLLGRDKEVGQALLDESASGLYWTVARRFRPAVERLNRETMGEVLDFRPTRTGFRADEIDHLRASVGAWAEGELRRTALKALRDETWNRRLDSPLQRVLSVRLQEARRTMLAEAEGLGAPDLEATVEIDSEPPSLHAEFRRAVMHSVDARLHVGGFEDAPLRWECRCRGTDGVACEHALALVEWALDALHDERHPLHAGMLSLVATPSWQRFLDDLDLRLPAAAEVGQKTRVVFRVETRDDPMTITPYLQKRGKSGVYSAGRKVKATQLLQKQNDAIAPEDQACLEALRAQSIAQRHAYATDAASRAMLALEGHPRVYLEHQPTKRIHVERVPLNISFEREDSGAARVRVRVGSTNVNLDTPTEATAARTVLAAVSEAESGEGGETTLHLARVGSRASALLDSLRAYPALVPESAFDRLITLLLRLQPGVDLRLPVSMRGEQVEPDKRLVARLEPVGDEALRVSLLVRPAPGGPVWGPGTGGRQSYGVADGQRVFAMRDLHEERERADAGAERFGLHLALVEREHVFRVVHLDDALELLSALREAEDVVVEWPDGAMPWQVGAVAASSGLNVRVRRAVDWFSVEGEVEVEDGSVALNTLLAAVREGRRFVQLSKGRFARIEADLRQRLLALDSRVFKERDGLGAGAASLATIATILEGPPPGVDADADADTDADAAHRAALKASELKHIDVDEEAFALIRDGLTHLDGDVPEPALPEELKAELRSYQRQGFDWLARLASWGVGGLLADEMGLGKTVQAIALLLLRKDDGPALVVAPTSVIGGWRNELHRFAPSLDVRVYHGSRRAQLLDGAGPGTVLLTSYDILARDAAPGSEDALRQLTFGLVVLDEAQAIKNPSTRRAKAAQALHRRMAVALTGTPLENHLGELWSLMRVVNPGLLGTRAHFRHRFSIPIEREGDDAAQDALRTLMQPFLLRRTKREVAPELPPRTEVVHSVELSEAERRLYDAARREALGQLSGGAADGEATEGPGESRRFEVLAALMRLRRLACHPRLVHKDSTLKGAKLEAFMRLTHELREAGHRALVFSQFTSHLAIVQEALDLARVPTLYLDGSTPQQVREERVDAFQKGSVPFFLISLKAGGTGLNLTAADYVIHLDPWWNPAAEDQASDRAHRIGQDKPVTVVRLVAADTIEESVLALHEEKRELADRLLEGSGAAGTLSTEQLRALITGPR